MPLHRQHKMIRIRSFQSFNDSVLRASRRHPQPFPDAVSRLVMARIHRQLSLLPISFRHDSRQDRSVLDHNVVSNRHFSSSLVVDGRFNVLYQRSGAMNIENLQTVTDSENWLAVHVSVLQQQFIDRIPRQIRLGRLRITRGAILLGQHIGATAGQ